MIRKILILFLIAAVFIKLAYIGFNYGYNYKKNNIVRKRIKQIRIFKTIG